MKKYYIPLLLLTCLQAALWQSCTEEVSPSADIPTVSFSSEVFPIIISNCTSSGCHGDEDTEEFELLNYEEIIEHCEVKPGDANGSLLYKVITKLSGSEAMPPDSPLTKEQIAKIYVWILQGANDN